ncbi:MAG: hypothetical protein QOG85_2193 [Gaiellaceae bacterium]|jgi:RimJ/RimL family protein N-acetyltransferase|nr:hypothetical protein [Gaiellaceae bacterium]
MVAGPTLETERLFLRPMVAEDLEALEGIFGDPAVMAAFGAPPQSRERVQRWLDRNLSHQLEHGYGLFAVCLKSDGRMIGNCGLELMEIDGEQVAELGYDFRSDCWNRGYATEAAIAVRDYALGVLGLPRLVSLVRPANEASARVAEKAGGRKTGLVEREARTYLLYVYASAHDSRQMKSTMGKRVSASRQAAAKSAVPGSPVKSE